MSETAATEVLEVPVMGMSCEGCVERVRQALAALPGVEELEVDVGTVRLAYYPEAVSPDVVGATIEGLGYSVPRKTESRNPLRRFLDRMIESNEKAFGHERLSCCTLKKD